VKNNKELKKNSSHSPLILASSSPRRLELLAQVGITPVEISPTHINEEPLDREKPADLALRLAEEKLLACPTKEDHFILAADTVVACGQRILPKAEDESQARFCLGLLSGRRHKVYGGLALRTASDKIFSRLVVTTVQFKKMDPKEIDLYLRSKEWQGKAGGYAIQGLAAQYIKSIQGSYSNIVGLSLYDTLQMLKGHQFFKD
jgi:septum formation protein